MTSLEGALNPLQGAAGSAPDWAASAWAILSGVLVAGLQRPVCVAFSGGSDSLALLRLAQAWGRSAGRPITALTVDHGLNAQSEDWTAAAAAAAAGLGVDWRGLAWRGEKPTGGLPAAARIARHALLADAARALDAGVILMGHTADDVAESMLIRADTPGHGYLRTWTPSPVWPDGRGVFLLRPLLAARRADLRAWLSAQNLGWLEDPANADPHFARSRARTGLASRPRDDTVGPISGWDRGVQRLAGRVEATADGRLLLSRRALAAAPVEGARRGLSAALVCAGGGARPPRGEPLQRLLDAILSGDALTSTLSGARIVAVGGEDAIGIGRDAGERARGGLATLRLEAGDRGVFDGRFEVQATVAPVQVVALAGRLGRLDRHDRARLNVVPGWARGSLPALIDSNGSVRLPEPLGDGLAVASTLVGRRFAAACGLVSGEAELATSLRMAL